MKNDLFSKLLVQVQDDTNLDDETRDSVVELINLVIADPSADNLRALALVLEKLGDTTTYLSALETIGTMKAATGNQGSTAPQA